MYYTPNAKKFKVQEFFPLETIRDHRESGMSDNSIWRLMDERILITSERLQARYGTMVINDYLWERQESV